MLLAYCTGFHFAADGKQLANSIYTIVQNTIAHNMIDQVASKGDGGVFGVACASFVYTSACATICRGTCARHICKTLSGLVSRVFPRMVWDASRTPLRHRRPSYKQARLSRSAQKRPRQPNCASGRPEKPNSADHGSQIEAPKAPSGAWERA